ncbi:MAG: hypothetical protein FWF60_06910 [Oscillospiraceae bacterium]|nr:hypothetical protein [Oscillospiraceae bacterium]
MSSDNVDALLMQVREEVENGRKFGNRRLVDPAVMQDLLESVRAAMPNTIERAKEIVAKRGEILDQARKDAAAIIADAQQKAAEGEASANARIQDAVQRAKERVMQARDTAEQTVADAQSEAMRLISEHSVTVMAREQSEQMLRQAREAAEKVENDSRQRAEQAIAEAQGYGEALQRRTEEWAMQYTAGVRSVTEDIVGEVEETLANALTDVRNTQKRLQTTLGKPPAAPEIHAPAEPDLF